MFESSPLRIRWQWLLFAAVIGAANRAAAAEVPADNPLTIVDPPPHRVFQRSGYDSRRSQVHAAGTPAWGSAFVRFHFRYKLPVEQGTVVEARTTLLPGCKGTPLDWREIQVRDFDADLFESALLLPAGGWYRLEFRLRRGERVVASAAVEPVGVGEVFLIAGQSYAAGANDEVLQLSDPAQRGVAFDMQSKSWRVAHDPQPGVGDGGTIWPAMIDELLPAWQVPIGLVNVAVGATTVQQWMPDGKLFPRLIEAGRQVSGFRAVLWQQGESDVFEKTTTDDYVQRLTAIHSKANAKWMTDAAWLAAKSTLHPTLYNNPQAEGAIRTAIDQLWQTPGFHRGPDTDLLDGENRGDIHSRRHFTGIGQRRAGRMWAGSLLAEFENLPIATLSHFDASWSETRTAEGLEYATMQYHQEIDSEQNQPAPTLLVFALGLRDMKTRPVYSQLAREMAAAGWLCVTIDPPCHGRDHRRGEPEGLLGWRHRLEQHEFFMADWARRAKATISELAATGRCDPNRVVASGTSRGAFCAFHLARSDERIKAVIGFAPVTDLAALDEFIDIQVSPAVQALALSNYADALADRKHWVTIGNRDERVDTARTLQFCDAVVEAVARRGLPEGAAAPVELSITATPGHSVAPEEYRRAAAWLKRQYPDW